MSLYCASLNNVDIIAIAAGAADDLFLKANGTLESARQTVPDGFTNLAIR